MKHHLFVENKYYNWYVNIILNARKRNVEDNVYYEKHHIIPKCSPFCGSNDVNNIVSLTYREHFLCHMLLTKFVIDPTGKRKMSFALWRMAHHRKHLKISSKMYETSKIIYMNIMKENPPHKGIPKTKTHIENMRGKRPHVKQNGKNNNNFKGYYFTPWGKYDSAHIAALNAPYEIPSTTIITLCKKYSNTPMKKKSKWAPKGIPLKELGYYFEEMTNA
jgi:hypothetical protein